MKQDGKRLSRQEWEVDYVRKLARELLAEVRGNKEVFVIYRKSQVSRLARAVLKFAK